MRNLFGVLVLAAVWFSLDSSVHAQPVLRVEGPEFVVEGSTFELEVFADLDLPSIAMRYGLCSDSAVATHLSVEMSSVLQSLNGGTGPAFVQFVENDSGYALEIFTDMFGLELVPAGLGVLLATSELIADQPTPNSSVEFCDTFGVPPISTSVSVEGLGVVPIQVGHDLPIVSPGEVFLRAEVNGDGVVNIADMISMNAQLFLGDPSPCPAALDANGDGTGDVADIVFLGSYLFLGGAPPPGSFPACELVPPGDPGSCPPASCSP